MDIDLLKKFYRGACSKDEAQKVIGWFSSKEQKEQLLEQLQTDWEQFDLPEDELLMGHHPDKVLQAIHNRRKKDARSAAEDGKVRSLNINRYYALRIASIVVLAVCVSFIMQIFLQNKPGERNSLVVSEVPAGQKKTLKLADGTKITLNAGSKISYPEQFPGDKREVWLEGEAFFEVARDTARPFTVRAGEVNTRVLGTSFNIRAYPDEQNIQVAVASGKVKVSQNNTNEKFLLPGKAVDYSIEKQLFKVFEFDRQEVFAWKEGTLYFKDASYQEVKIALERWYGVAVYETGEAKEAWQYSGSFQQESLENVLRSIGYVKQFSHTHTGNKVVITFNKQQ
jgi:transmembrane sensor